MNVKTRFFKSVLLLQFPMILLLGIWLYSSFEKQEFLTISSIHPYEVNFLITSPAIFFCSSFLLSGIYFLLKHKNNDEEEIEIQKKLRVANFWNFAFYCNVFCIIIILLFTLIANLQLKDIFVIEGSLVIYIFAFFQVLLVPVLSLIVASFLLSSGIYWKTNRSLAIITLILGFVFLMSWITAEYAFIDEFKRISENYALMKDYETVPETQTVTEVEADENEYHEDEFREESVEAIEIQDAWEFFINNKYDLKGKQEFTEIRYPMYSDFLGNTEEDKDYFLSGYVQEIRKNPEAISFAFQTYKYVLYNSVSKRTYRIANFDKIIDGLLFTYEDLFSEESDGNAQKIYRIMSAPRESYDLDAGEYYTQIEKYFTPETIELLESTRLSNGSQFSNGDIVWLYSFWARRNDEKNRDEVVSILREIKENYN